MSIGFPTLFAALVFVPGFCKPGRAGGRGGGCPIERTSMGGGGGEGRGVSIVRVLLKGEINIFFGWREGCSCHNKLLLHQQLFSGQIKAYRSVQDNKERTKEKEQKVPELKKNTRIGM